MRTIMRNSETFYCFLKILSSTENNVVELESVVFRKYKICKKSITQGIQTSNSDGIFTFQIIQFSQKRRLFLTYSKEVMEKF